MQDSALDFLIMVIILGVVLLIGFGVTVPLVEKSKQLQYQQTYDKTVGELNGDKAPEQYDGCLSCNEIALQTMGQTYFMPTPGFIMIAGTKIIVANNVAFSPNSEPIGNQADSALSSWFSQFTASYKTSIANKPTSLSTARFRIMYDMNNTIDTSDDSYSVFILLTRASTGKQEFFKCTSGGGITDGGGHTL